MNTDASVNRSSSKRRLRVTALLVTGAIVVFGVWTFRASVNQFIAEKGTLVNDAPNPDHLAEAIINSPDPVGALVRAWESQKVVHRQVAVKVWDKISLGTNNQELDKVLLSAALDPDISVREVALGHLQFLRHPHFAALAAAQLRDVDPQVRLLGLQHLRSVAPELGLSYVVGLLNDPDPLVVITALKRIETWTGEEFGVRLGDTVSLDEEYSQRSYEVAKAGANRAKEWWAKHASEFRKSELVSPKEARRGLRPLAGGFELKELGGETVRLSDYAGKVVVINFWTTWCTACVKEIPALLALQRKMGNAIGILGVSLDFLPDSHGRHAAVEDGTDAGEHEHEGSHNQQLEEVRRKVARTAEARGINYPVLLDEKNIVGARFNGGELPTTVIVDPAGRIYRRFVGARSLNVFEALVKDAQK